VISHLAKLGSGADCVSIGEVRRALISGIPKYKIIFSGVGKRDDEIEEALREDILLLNLESEAEMERESGERSGDGACRRDCGKDRYGGQNKHKGESEHRPQNGANNSAHLDPVGIHFHIGSQLTELEPIKEAAAIVADLVRSLKAIKIDIRFYAQAIFSVLHGLDLTVVCEPGRFMVGNSGFFLTRVLYEKVNEGKRFIIVDGGMNDLLRPSLYNAYHRVEVLGKSGACSEADLVGPVCESGDFFAKSRMLPATEPGDLVIVHSAGAYGFVMQKRVSKILSDWRRCAYKRVFDRCAGDADRRYQQKTDPRLFGGYRIFERERIPFSSCNQQYKDGERGV